ncbi:MAG: PAS domain S-box protein, partial [Candidatus Glassbacteria bacterium]|nr:PAS domain S-box protein [Candidatus Glassbacteria bacterium]
MAVRKGNQELLTQIDEALVRLKSTGEFDRIIDKWSGRQVVLIEQRRVWKIYGAAVLALVTLISLSFAVYVGRSKRIALSREIAERERAEEELTLFFNVSSDLICVANTDGYFTRVNPVCKQMLGWQDSEFVGKPFVDFIHPEDVDTTLQVIERQRNGEPVKAFVNRYRCKDGSYRWLEWVATPAIGKTVFAIARDITERRHTQAQLIQSSKLATLGEMATGIAHELNQPLSVIRMAADSTLERLEDGDVGSEYLRRKLDRINAQIERAVGIIDHMRIFGRVAEEKPQAFDPRKAVEGALSLVTQQLRLRSIEVETALAERCRSVSGHGAQLEQVVLNLLTNAR